MLPALLAGLLVAGGAINGFTFTDEEATKCKHQVDSLRGFDPGWLQTERADAVRAALFQQVHECVLGLRAAKERARIGAWEGTMQEERDRRRQAQIATALAEARDEQERRLADPRWAVPLYSAELCRAQRDRASTSAGLAKEKRLNREVGVYNDRVMNDYLKTLRDADARKLTAHRALANLGAKPHSCSNKLVSRIATCLDEKDNCDDETERYLNLTKDPADL